MSFRVASSPHFLRTTFGLFDVHDHIHSSWEKVAEWTSCILKYFFSLAQVQIPKTNLWRDLYMDSTMATISGIFTSQLQSCVCSFFFFKKKTTLWDLFIDEVQLSQGYSHFVEAVYSLPLSSQIFLVLILPTSEG